MILLQINFMIPAILFVIAFILGYLFGIEACNNNDDRNHG